MEVHGKVNQSLVNTSDTWKQDTFKQYVYSNRLYVKSCLNQSRHKDNIAIHCTVVDRASHMLFNIVLLTQKTENDII